MKNEFIECIKYFWAGFGGGKNSAKNYPKNLKLIILKSFSEIKISKNVNISNKRKKFNENKYKLHSFNKFDVCFVCGCKGHARHHIIQIKNGGENHKDNIVTLCNWCHEEIHPWLKKKIKKEKVSEEKKLQLKISKNKDKLKNWKGKIRVIKKFPSTAGEQLGA